MSSQQSFLKATRELGNELDRLRFDSPVRYVYNPLDYAWEAHEQYLRRYFNGKKRIVFLGMNPGPFGMAQTGVPFGEVAAVRDWLGVRSDVKRPKPEHPRKPVLGFECPRSEVSGRRLWGLFARRFGSAPQFFADHFVYNYCPLLFLDGGPNGRNLTPETLSGASIHKMQELCDRHLIRLIESCGAMWAIGVGNFAARRLSTVFQGDGLHVGKILHPSPANPAANRNWEGVVEIELHKLGVWPEALP